MKRQRFRIVLLSVLLTVAMFALATQTRRCDKGFCAEDVKPPFVSPIRVRLTFPQKTYKPANSLSFNIEITNIGKRPLTLYKLRSWVVLYADIRDMNGSLIDVSPHITKHPQIVGFEFETLSLGDSRCVTVKWRDEWKLPSPHGRYRVRFLYSNEDSAYYAKEWGMKAWDGYALSNTVILDFKDDEVNVVGDWHELEPEVKISFLQSGYKLIKAYDGKRGEPAEAYLKLFAVKDNEKRAINTSQGLQGVVQIKSKEDALSFVRLFTSVDTHYLFRDLNIIEATRSDANNGERFGSVWPYWFGSKGERKLQPVSIKQEGSDFLIQRNIITYPNSATRKSKIYRSLERVSSDGKYEHKVARIIFEDNFSESKAIVESYVPYY